MRLLPPPRIDAFILVSIHAPVKDATRNIQATILELLGFNPRTRKGCDGRVHPRCTGIGSFNPRTRKGCDLFAKLVLPIRRSFNPRTRKGCDGRDNLRLSGYQVSIHAPVKDATGMSISLVLI